MKDKNLHIIQEVVANTGRFILAASFIFSGFVKAVDPLGFQYKIQDYLAAFGMASWFPSFFPLLGGIVLSSVEFFIGISLFFGTRRTIASSLALMLMIFMTPLTLYLALFDPVSDCGCFGDAWVLTNWETFGKNVVLLLAAAGTFRYRKMVFRFISVKMEWLVSLYTLFFVFTLSFYCLDRLPVLDFRPYKIGKNISEGMTIPDGAKPSVYESIFVLEKNGEKKEFTLDNYPDSTWTFVDTRTVLKEKGYEPPIHDFSIMDLDTGNDITEDVLTDMGYTFLLVAHRIEEADDSNIDLINEIYDYSVEHGYRFYCLTSSPEEQIELWKDKTGAEYPFCQMDDITLKTMVRSNPGLMLIKNGTILNKWSDEDIPDEYVLTDKLENLPLGQQKLESDFHTVGYVFLWFVIPLLLVLGVDVLVIRRRERKKSFINPLNKENKMRKNIVAGNWKMNKTLQEGIALAKELNEALANEKPNCDVIICTPFIHLASVTPLVDAAKIGVGAENCADKASGAYTGEVSAEMVASTGAKYVILGHSERRAYYHETPEILKEKTILALANGLTPIFCIGEVLEEREAGKHFDVVKAQIEESLFNLSAEDFGKIILAYEPVWAIGTGKTATAEQAQEMHAFIRKTIADKYGNEVAENCSILYGGSCKPSNAKELFANKDVDGGLIGGAALEVDSFMGIVNAF